METFVNVFAQTFLRKLPDNKFQFNNKQLNFFFFPFNGTNLQKTV
jgi:hypothetical protein